MSENDRLRITYCFLLAPLVVAMGAPLSAEDSIPSRWAVRAYGVGLFPVSDEARVEVAEGVVTLRVSDGTGFGLDLEYLVTRRIGVEAALMVGDYEGRLHLETETGEFRDAEDIRSEIVALGANYHFTPDRRSDLYAGVFVHMSLFNGVVFLTEEGMYFKRPWDDDIKAGIKAGITVPFGTDSHWSFNAQVRLLRMVLEAESDRSGGRDVDLNPWIPSLGIGYSF